ncbi:MAG: hypothetical protein HY877_02785 [Deltaproteobacteria bacterium]|nr:hypothetical protein [Deltaproteobacteria bacterium]
MMSNIGLKNIFKGSGEKCGSHIFHHAFKIFLTVALVSGLSGAVYANGYKSTLRKWTRHKQLFNVQTLQTKIMVHATYYNPAFRKVYEEEHIKKKYLDGVKAETYIAEQEQKQSKGDEFFVGMYVRKPYKEFSRGGESFWEAVLTTARGEEISPIRIESVAVTPYEKVMFPYLNRWSQAYRVVFPKTDLTKPFTLTMRSVIGQTHLHWE